MVVQDHPHNPQVCVPAPAQIAHVKQYRLPGGHEEITGTIAELEKAKKYFPQHTALVILPYGQDRNRREHGT
jgi:hypothetical protein